MSAQDILAPEALLAASASRTGLSDFGDPGFRDGLDRLLSEIESLGLSEAYAAASAGRIGAALDSRAIAIAGLKAHPEVLKEPIREPLIIAGIVRSGTTALHLLLSLDPQFQGPENWLTSVPMPRPPRAQWDQAPQYRAVADAMRAYLEAAPIMYDDHLMSAEGIEESLNILCSGFASNMWPSMWPIPKYDAWFRGRNDVSSYRWLADVLRLIGKDDPRRWLLKNPTDIFSLEEVLTVFPDAMIVQTHRDPVEAVPSVCKLIYAAQEMFCGELASKERVGQREAGMWAAGVERAHRIRATSSNKFFDIEFERFVTDQLGQVRALYDYFDLKLSADTEALMRAWLDTHPRKPASLEKRFKGAEFGLTEEGLKSQFAAYRAQRGYT